MNFTTARSEIENLVSKKEQIIVKAAGIVAEAVKDRMKSGKLDTRTSDDIKRLLEGGFSKEDVVSILLQAMVIFAGMNAGSSNNSRRSSSIF